MPIALWSPECEPVWRWPLHCRGAWYTAEVPIALWTPECGSVRRWPLHCRAEAPIAVWSLQCVDISVEVAIADTMPDQLG